MGANVGLFAFSAAYRSGSTGRVIAVEPDTFLQGLLHRSAASLPDTYAPVDLIPAAVADTVSIVKLNIAGRGRAFNSLEPGTSQVGGFRQSQSALCLTLDWVANLLPSPNVLKIDVEGFELPVLEGAKRLLQTAKPRIHCEVKSQAAFDLLKSCGYEMYDADNRDVRKRLPLAAYSYNMVAIPS